MIFTALELHTAVECPGVKQGKLLIGWWLCHRALAQTSATMSTCPPAGTSHPLHR